jgi:biopolymer transport protein TolQ
MEFTLTGLWGHMGLFARLVVIALAVMSLSSVVVMVERIVVFFLSSSGSRAFAEKTAAILARGDIPAVAELKFQKNETGHLGRVITAGLDAWRSRGPNKDLAVESVARALERQAQREAQAFKRGLGILATVGSTAPFVGLLGTVVGIVNAFQMMAATGSGGLGTVSAGIAEALVTTAVGLLAAIPAVMAYNFLSTWVEARSVDLAESSNEFLDIVSRHLAGDLTPAGK